MRGRRVKHVEKKSLIIIDQERLQRLGMWVTKSRQ